jgi:hypothetical protein
MTRHSLELFYLARYLVCVKQVEMLLCIFLRLIPESVAGRRTEVRRIWGVYAGPPTGRKIFEHSGVQSWSTEHEGEGNQPLFTELYST